MPADVSGPPVLLLHGSGPGTTAAAWDPLVAALAPRHRVIAPDLLGFGESPRPEGSLRAAWTRQALELVDSLGVTSFAVVGNSAGAAIALSVAAARPHAVTRVVAVGAMGHAMPLPARPRRPVGLRHAEPRAVARADRAHQPRPRRRDAGGRRGALPRDARAAVVPGAVPAAAAALGRRPRAHARGARGHHRAGPAGAWRAGPRGAAARQL